MTKSWKSKAVSLNEGIESLLEPLGTVVESLAAALEKTGNPNVVNVVIFACRGLCDERGCPEKFRAIAGQLVPDGTAGPILAQALSFLGELADS